MKCPKDVNLLIQALTLREWSGTYRAVPWSDVESVNYLNIFRKLHFKILSARLQPFCVVLNMLTYQDTPEHISRLILMRCSDKNITLYCEITWSVFLGNSDFHNEAEIKWVIICKIRKKATTLSWCWPRSISPYGITRQQWVETFECKIYCHSLQGQMCTCGTSMHVKPGTDGWARTRMVTATQKIYATCLRWVTCWLRLLFSECSSCKFYFQQNTTIKQ